MRRPDPRTHQRAHLWLGWDDPAPRARIADPRERIWWGVVGAFAAFALLLIAQILGVASA